MDYHGDPPGGNKKFVKQKYNAACEVVKAAGHLPERESSTFFCQTLLSPINKLHSTSNDDIGMLHQQVPPMSYYTRRSTTVQGQNVQNEGRKCATRKGRLQSTHGARR